MPILRRQKRSETFRVRLTDAEHGALRSLAQRTGICRSRLARKAIRELVTGNVDLLQHEQQAVLELARQMRLIGVNLNQIARQLNRGDGATSALAESVEALRERLTDCECEFAWRRQVAAARARTVPEYGRG